MLNNASILITGGKGSFGHTFVPMTLKKVAPDFNYSSDNNTEWMEVDALRAWINENGNLLGKF